VLDNAHRLGKYVELFAPLDADLNQRMAVSRRTGANAERHATEVRKKSVYYWCFRTCAM
jgi:hypothetical protein